MQNLNLKFGIWYFYFYLSKFKRLNFYIFASHHILKIVSHKTNNIFKNIANMTLSRFNILGSTENLEYKITDLSLRIHHSITFRLNL